MPKTGPFVLAVVLLALGGCIDGPPVRCVDTVVTVADLDAQANRLGDFPQEIPFLVVDGAHGGTPVAGAQLTALMATPVPAGTDPGMQAAREAVEDGKSADDASRFLIARAALRTDPSGHAFLRVPAGTRVAAVGTAPGYTHETVEAYAQAQFAQETTVALYPVELHAWHNGTLGMEAALDDSWSDSFAPEWNLTITPGLTDRWRGLEASLEWTNDMPGEAQLFLELHGGPTVRSQSIPGAAGPQVARVVVDQADIPQWRLDDVGASIDHGLGATLDGVPYTSKVVASFRGGASQPTLCVPHGATLDGPVPLDSLHWRG